MSLESSFLFVCCQPGAEALLKAELAREAPRLRFAFSRPGFVTFKDVDSRSFRPDFELPSVFARAYGLSLGQCKSPDPAAEVFAHALALRAVSASPLRLHVWERPQHVPGEEPLGYQRGEIARSVEQRLRERAASMGSADLFHGEVEASPDDLVLDVLVMEPVEDSPLFSGFHRQSKGHIPFPGGEIPVEMPERAPSRAFVKLEQAIRWSRLPLRARDVAVELGSAPGGASFAMLLRGMEVWGIDPAAMDPVVWTDPRCEKRFHHVKKAFSEVRREDLPKAVQWLVLDINAPVRVSLPYVETLASWFSDTLLGMILTLKINDPKHARHIPEWRERMETLGLRQVRATQLSVNKREICLTAISRRALIRT